MNSYKYCSEVISLECSIVALTQKSRGVKERKPDNYDQEDLLYCQILPLLVATRKMIFVTMF